MEGDRIADVSFEGSGCAISQASASLMTTQIKGKTAAEAEELYRRFHDIITSGKEPEEISDLAAFAGVHAFPARIKCATLGWHAALNALKGDDSQATTETHVD
jgi:nitrogen fixation NifU-like protein